MVRNVSKVEKNVKTLVRTLFCQFMTNDGVLAIAVEAFWPIADKRSVVVELAIRWSKQTFDKFLTDFLRAVQLGL